MKEFLNLLKTNPKKAILLLISLLVFAVGSFFINACSFQISGADNVTGVIKPFMR